MFKKYLLLVVLALSFQAIFSQKAQRIAYIDMAFILEKIPEYQQAQDQLNTKIISWQRRLDREKEDIEALKKDFSNEKALLTDELIQEREDDIYFKDQEYNQLQDAYFGPKGDLYLYRKLLVQPIQDKVYNAIQEIAVKKNYDFVLDNSSDLIILYTNKAFDISDLVVNSINKVEKQEAIKAKRDKFTNKKKQVVAKPVVIKTKKEAVLKPNLTPAKMDNTVATDTIFADTTEDQIDTVGVVLNQINQPKDSILVNTKVDETPLIKDTPSDEVLKRINARNEKRELLLEKIRLINEAKEKKKEEDRKDALAKRDAKLKEIDKNKQALIRKNDSINKAKKNN
ncbi:MAG: OmpH family outer membrane protein [Zetaproteobacteria bacterium]|nr:OmpH family outer membrane protein [Zetaproteobacteria bacterium]